MELEITKKEDICIVKVLGDLTIYNAESFQNQLVTVFDDCSRIAIDLSSVNELDTSGVQLLMNAKKESIRRNQLLRLVNHSSVVIHIFDLMGLIGFFGDKIKIPVEERKNYSFKYGIKKQEITV